MDANSDALNTETFEDKQVSVAFLDTKEAQDDRAFTESRTLLLRSVFQSGSQRKKHMGKSRKNLVRKTGQTLWKWVFYVILNWVKIVYWVGESFLIFWA